MVCIVEGAFERLGALMSEELQGRHRFVFEREAAAREQGVEVDVGPPRRADDLRG